MLTHLNIRNFAIIDELAIDLEQGLTVVTGETGAGKSIMVDALSLVLGDRAEASVIRAEASQAEISAQFTISDLPQVQRWLAEQALEADDDCILRRIIHREKSSKGYINGRPATMQMLRELGELLVDIHGQHAHQGLSKRPVQLAILDQFGQLSSQRMALAELWRTWRSTQEKYQRLYEAVQEGSDRKELLSYQVQEMESLEITEDELATIEEDHKRLSNMSELMQGSESELHRLYGDEGQSVYSQLNSSLATLQQLERLDPALSDTNGLLQEALIQVQEASQSLEQYLSQTETDPEAYHQIDRRLGLLHELARKHRTDIAGLFQHYQQLSNELADIALDAEGIEALRNELERQKSQWLEAAQKLSKARKSVAKKLQKAVNHYLESLGMQGGVFDVSFNELELDQANKTGIDKIDFMISANPGQPLQPLAKVASGGELSRMSLAIQVVTHNDSSIPCLIFDEVDVGIGGGTAEVVGNLLRELAQRAQVLCVTHQAQVAAKGMQHFTVSKSSDKSHTSTQITKLTSAQRTAEIARMIGGLEITEQTLKYAEELLS